MKVPVKYLTPVYEPKALAGKRHEVRQLDQAAAKRLAAGGFVTLVKTGQEPKPQETPDVGKPKSASPAGKN